MFPVYEEKKENLHFRSKTSRHASPHLHNSIEFIYITEGTLELGMGQEHMWSYVHIYVGKFQIFYYHISDRFFRISCVKTVDKEPSCFSDICFKDCIVFR